MTVADLLRVAATGHPDDRPLAVETLASYASGGTFLFSFCLLFACLIERFALFIILFIRMKDLPHVSCLRFSFIVCMLCCRAEPSVH